MKTTVDYLKSIGFFAGGIALLALFLALLNLFGLSSKITNVLNLIGVIILFFLLGIRHGKECASKGYLAGIKIGMILLFFLILLSFLGFDSGFHLVKFLYYGLLLLTAILGAMLGINKKSEKK